MTRRLARSAVVSWLALLSIGCLDDVPGLWPRVGTSKSLDPEPTQFLLEDERDVLKQDVEEPLVGAADYHMHQFADIGFGGRVLSGKSFDPRGIAYALPVCGPQGACLDDRLWMACREVKCRFERDKAACRAACDRSRCDTRNDHGHLGSQDVVGSALSESYLHRVSGYPDFVGWPHYNTYTHQQVYHRWLRRAFDGGLKLIVMHAVTNEVLCKFLDHGRGAACDDMSNVDAQLDAAEEFEAWVDEGNDGAINGNGWYRIATSPQDARQIIADGAMAVVLGIEVDSLFNCHRDREDCELEDVRAALEHYRSRGVRHVFPVHVFDNAFGGTAASSDLFNWGSAVINEDAIEVDDCGSDGYEFRYGEETPGVSRALGAMSAFFGVSLPKWPSGSEAVAGNAARALFDLKSGRAPGTTKAKKEAHCNARGLEDLGEEAVHAMMASKMIIDVDHLSFRGRARLFEIAEGCGYRGLVSGHSGFTELYQGSKKHEGQLTSDELTCLLRLGGLAAPLLNEGDVDHVEQYERAERHGRPVTNDCSNSAKSFAQAYLYTVDRMRDIVDPLGAGHGFVAVAIGSDLNGLAGMPAPRFGRYACAGDGAEQHKRVTYPVNLYGNLGKPMHPLQAGYRVFDINVDGYANVGLFPDFVEELRMVGITQEDLEPLFNSAEAYIRLWEAVESGPLTCGDEIPPHTPSAVLECGARMPPRR